jgi:hypothetical protein
VESKESGEVVRIALIQVDGKQPNLALMKLSAWHKAQGDGVDASPVPGVHYDRAYKAKVFDFSPEYRFKIHADEVVQGGTGYDLTTALPPEVEAIYPDYAAFHVDHAVGYTTRGCVRHCPFCVVPKKEGLIHRVADLSDFWHGQEWVQLLDNNLAASPKDFERTCLQLIDAKVRVDFSQGLDLRLITVEQARLLKQVRRYKQVHFAWDNMREETEVRAGLDRLRRAEFPMSAVMVYVLIGFDSTPDEDLYRVETLRKLGVDPFVMPFVKSDPYQHKFARWVNRMAVFNKCNWQDYQKAAA